jgi:hypothetical protein
VSPRVFAAAWRQSVSLAHALARIRKFVVSSTRVTVSVSLRPLVSRARTGFAASTTDAHSLAPRRCRASWAFAPSVYAVFARTNAI